MYIYLVNIYSVNLYVATIQFYNRSITQKSYFMSIWMSVSILIWTSSNHQYDFYVYSFVSSEITYKQNHIVSSFCIWFLSFIMFIHVVVYTCSFSPLNSQAYYIVWIYLILFIHLSTDGCLDCFQFEVNINNVAKNVCSSTFMLWINLLELNIVPVFREILMCNLPEKHGFSFKFHRPLEPWKSSMVPWIPN